MMKPARQRIDVNLDELDRVLEGARQAPLSEADCDKLKSALHALAAMLVRPRHTEKTSAVVEKGKAQRLAPGLPRIPTHPRRPDMDAMVQRRLAVRGRWRSRTRS